MRIAIYIGELDIMGGTHKQVMRLGQYLVAQGHELHILTPTYVAGKTYDEFSNLPVTALSTISDGPVNWRVRLRAKLAPVRLALAMPRVDVLNVHDNRGVLFFIAARALNRARHTVWQINDLHPAFRVGASTGDAPKRLVDHVHVALNKWMARRVDAISVNVKKNVERVSTYLAVSAQLFHCGVDLPKSEPVPLRPGTGPIRLLSTGVFFPYRNYENLIGACASAQTTLGRPIELTIVGDTRYNPEYAEGVRLRATRDGVALRVRENLSQDELDAEISANHVFAFVNVDQSWGLSVFEAAARAKPVVLSDSVGACELLAGHAGFELADARVVESIARAIVKLVADPEACVAAALQARRHVRSMTWASMYSAPVESLFARLLLVDNSGQQVGSGRS